MILLFFCSVSFWERVREEVPPPHAGPSWVAFNSKSFKRREQRGVLSKKRGAKGKALPPRGSQSGRAWFVPPPPMEEGFGEGLSTVPDPVLLANVEGAPTWL